MLDFSIIWEYRVYLWNGFLLTIWVTAISISGSLLLGIAVGCFSNLPGFLPKRLADAYISALRNVPVVVKLFFFYFAVGLDAIPASLISLILHQSAYIADVTSAGLRSIPREQFEAARALGHSYTQVYRFVLVPQAVRIIIPPLISQFIEILKNSAIVMMIAVEELTFKTQQIEAETFRGFEVATVVTILYFLIALNIVNGVTFLRKRVLER